jgi:glycosyltransferase involved in cell wall biosynthesis
MKHEGYDMRASGLKVLMISPYPLYEGRVVGGVEAVASALAPTLAAQEEVAQVSVVCFHPGAVPTPYRKVSDKLHIWYFRRHGWPVLTRSLLEVWQARRIAAAVAPTIVHGQGVNAQGDVATRISRYAVITVHGQEQMEARLERGILRGRIRAGLVDNMVAQILSRARVVIAISSYNARLLAGRVRGQLVSIPNPIAEEFFIEPSYESAGPRVLFAGVMVRRKNVEGLLRAFALARKHVADARLTIVGPAPDPVYAQEIRDLVQALQLGGAVDFVGHVENARLLQEMRACRAVALFSHEESSPTVLAQALAMGKPVVTSRVGGIADVVIDGESGFLVDSGDEQAFAERLVALLQSPERCRAIGQRGHAIARQYFEPVAVARRTLDAYQLALNPRATVGWEIA